MTNCSFCDQPVDPDHKSTWKEVKGFVGGPRKDSMRLREDTGCYAHDKCVAKSASGQPVDQPSLLDDEPVVVKVTEDEVTGDFFDER